jgi:hypothetical protein
LNDQFTVAVEPWRRSKRVISSVFPTWKGKTLKCSRDGDAKAKSEGKAQYLLFAQDNQAWLDARKKKYQTRQKTWFDPQVGATQVGWMLQN